MIPMWLHTLVWVAGGALYGWLYAQVRYPKEGDR